MTNDELTWHNERVRQSIEIALSNFRRRLEHEVSELLIDLGEPPNITFAMARIKNIQEIMREMRWD